MMTKTQKKEGGKKESICVGKDLKTQIIASGSSKTSVTLFGER